MQGNHGAPGIKIGCAKGLVGAISCNQPFQSFTTGQETGSSLRFRGPAVTSASNFPTWRSAAWIARRGWFRPG